jgi:hypothetical protein
MSDDGPLEHWDGGGGASRWGWACTSAIFCVVSYEGSIYFPRSPAVCLRVVSEFIQDQNRSEGGGGESVNIDK